MLKWRLEHFLCIHAQDLEDLSPFLWIALMPQIPSSSHNPSLELPFGLSRIWLNARNFKLKKVNYSHGLGQWVKPILNCRNRDISFSSCIFLVGSSSKTGEGMKILENQIILLQIEPFFNSPNHNIAGQWVFPNYPSIPHTVVKQAWSHA